MLIRRLCGEVRDKIYDGFGLKKDERNAEEQVEQIFELVTTTYGGLRQNELLAAAKLWVEGQSSVEERFFSINNFARVLKDYIWRLKLEANKELALKREKEEEESKYSQEFIEYYKPENWIIRAIEEKGKEPDEDVKDIGGVLSSYLIDNNLHGFTQEELIEIRQQGEYEFFTKSRSDSDILRALKKLQEGDENNRAEYEVRKTCRQIMLNKYLLREFLKTI